ncbi:UPF0481 protein At3g47200-like [Oryza glaberrima]|uniref:Uncharacterized protein n=1 Tax=Oryza glaberrima TaxID=4538 RepID=I1R0S6_ORYGL|nr:UPF0481 protein At3g47200-like [Oryza glaberrima]
MEETGAAEANVMESPPSPTTAMANSGSCVVEIPTDMTLSHDDGSEPSPGEKSMVRPQRESRHTIYRVPKYIKDMTNPNAYQPQMVSLGPFHYGEAPLQPMEAHKKRAVAQSLIRSGKPLQEFTAAVEKIAEQLRGAYENLGEEWSGERFVELMVTDGCFLLEMMATFIYEGEVEGYAPDDPVFSKHGALYLSDCIISDMLVIENQLPLQLLQTLMFVVDPDNFQDKRWIGRWVRYLLSYTITPSTPVDDLQGLHPLDLFQKSIRGTSRNNQMPIDDDVHMPSAAELREAGIHFEVSTGEGFAGTVSFERGVLSVPKILLYDSAERMFLNLMAFEKLHPGAGNEVTAFVFFMDELINTAKDVRLLRAKGIIKHGLGSDEAVANLINNTLTKGAAIDPETSLYNVIVKVDAYSKKRRNNWRAILLHTYFSNPWVFISLVTATVLLIATVIQTVYAIMSFNSKT